MNNVTRMPSLGAGRLAKSIPGTGSGMKVLLGSPAGDDSLSVVSRGSRRRNRATEYFNVFIRGDAVMVTRGTKIRVIDVGRGSMKVRILEGSQSGKTGWIPFEWVSP